MPGSRYRSISVEVVAVQGIQPSQKAIDSMVSFLRQETGKPVTVTNGAVIPKEQADRLTPEAMATLAFNGPKHDDEAYLPILFYCDEGASNKYDGWVPSTYHCGIFVNMAFAQPYDSAMAWTLRHESSHVLGLCRNRSHGDGVHCNDSNCVMYHAQVIRDSLTAMIFTSNAATIERREKQSRANMNLCSKCQEDLHQPAAQATGNDVEFAGPFLVRHEKGYCVASLAAYTFIMFGDAPQFDWKRQLADARKSVLEHAAELKTDPGSSLCACARITVDDHSPESIASARNVFERVKQDFEDGVRVAGAEGLATLEAALAKAASQPGAK